MKFNKAFSGQRSMVEIAFGHLKSKFKILNSSMRNYSIESIQEIVVACIVAYNIHVMSENTAKASQEERETYERKLLE